MTLIDNCQPRALEEAVALHAAFYRDSDWLEVERRNVFGRSWQLVGHVSQLENTGDHVVGEVAGTPVIVVRNAGGRLNGFHNVCRHRAGPLATCNGKGSKRLVCAYHSWSYDLDGNLKTTPEMGDAENFDKTRIRLPELSVGVWEGLVFVSLTPDVPPLEAVYGGIRERIAPVDLASMRFYHRVTYDIDCNWKVYIDNFLEGYHVPAVHPGLAKLIDYAEYRTELAPWYSLQHSPLRPAAAEIYGDGEAWYYFVYPNIMLNIMPGRLQTNKVTPLGPNRCRVKFDYYYSDAADAQARVHADQEVSDEIQQEDISICLHVQKGLMSGGYEAGRLCPKRESGVWHFQNLLRGVYAAELEGAM